MHKSLNKIEANKLNFKYASNHVIKNLSINIEGNGVFVIYGESGCGKTTLLNILSLINKSQGELFINNTLINHNDSIQIEELRKNKIAYFFQDLNLISSLSVVENLEIISLIKGELLDYSKLEYYYKLLDIENLITVAVENLSGGERQRIALLKTLVFDYEIILIDEPTNNLDDKNIETVLTVLEHLGNKAIVIVVSHSKKLYSIATKLIDFNEINGDQSE